VADLLLEGNSGFQPVAPNTGIGDRNRPWPTKILAGPQSCAVLSGYKPQIANAVIEAGPLLVMVTTAVPVQVLGALSYDADTAALTLLWVTLAPPLISLLPVGRLAVEVPAVLPTAGLPPVEAAAAVTSWWCRRLRQVPPHRCHPWRQWVRQGQQDRQLLSLQPGPGTLESAPVSPGSRLFRLPRQRGLGDGTR
jgi:hypothetical protein